MVSLKVLQFLAGFSYTMGYKKFHTYIYIIAASDLLLVFWYGDMKTLFSQHFCI
jgi:hypothetical protein